jgi:NAD(P)-dependent dehydrogenase (short-subunit alcohol dehydrogenase family)
MAASGTGAFQAAKAALSMLTKSWTAEYGPRGVRVNSVDPWFILTRINEHMRDMCGGYLKSEPAGRGAPRTRWPKPSDSSSLLRPPASTVPF